MTAPERVPLGDAMSALETARALGLVSATDTAVLFHDLGRLAHRQDQLRAAFPEHALHTLAIKANPLIGVLKCSVDAGMGLEAASIEEVHIALAAGCPPERIVFDSPAKTEGELSFALSRGVVINANGLLELERIRALLSRQGSRSQVGLRINPGLAEGTIGTTSVASRHSKFGVPLWSRMGDVVGAFSKYSWLTGLHVHVGSQGCEPALLLEAARATGDLVRRIEEGGAARVTNIDIGGGLPTQYDTEAPGIGFEEYATMLRAAVPEFFCGERRLTTEFGRSLQAGCGFAVARVEYVHLVDDVPIAVIHLGADLLLRPVYQPQHWHHEFALLDRDGKLKTGPTRRTTIAGPLCFSDIVARDVALASVEPGDSVMIRDTGAYTLSMWSRHCSRAMPAVLGFDDPRDSGTFRILRRRESVSDVVALWSTDPAPSGRT